MSEMDPILEAFCIAAHESLVAYTTGTGGTSPRPWLEKTPEEKFYVALIVADIAYERSVTPADIHDRWMNTMLQEGWTYGLYKDEMSKTHPCLRPFDQLPPIEQKKDEIFLSTIKHMLEPLLRDQQRHAAEIKKAADVYLAKKRAA